jgi:hypothetical protein
VGEKQKMKYSLRFFYKLMLKNKGIVVKSRAVGTNAISFDIQDAERDETWQITVEPGKEDKLNNVVYLMSYRGIQSFSIAMGQ